MTTTGLCLCKNLIEAIASYGPLQEFCAYKFEKQPVFFFQADENNPPAKSDAPFIVLYSDSADYSEPQAIIRPVLVGCVVEDKEIDDSNDFAKGLYKGFETAEIFERHVFDAIDCYLKESEQESEQELSMLEAGEVLIEAFYPYFHARRQFRIITGR